MIQQEFHLFSNTGYSTCSHQASTVSLVKPFVRGSYKLLNQPRDVYSKLFGNAVQRAPQSGSESQ
ncbi:hypothetical protein A986_01589 [Pseudomonas fluorescens BRIP34879]|nr:hypothetical protein A986_01589 [Pseudomonas fluorescens BRIP34879]